MIQKHAARRVHYDLRLEMNGVLVSWAVPKGPSPNPADKRLAVKVEEHPVEYADFEGTIPEGNYGAGAVIVWDRGIWIPMGDPDEGIAKGKLLFELRGYKLRGRWTLVKTKQGPNDWLFIKEKDASASEEGAESLPDDSIFSGLTVEELKSGADRTEEISRKLQSLRARKQRVKASEIKVMLAETREKPFSKPGWLFEIKYDGYRLVAARQNGEAVLLSRAGNDLTATFPEVEHAVSALPFEHVVMDGEVAVHDESGFPSFQRLQKRGLLNRLAEIKRAAVELPATLYVFDLLAFGEYDLRLLPLETRKSLLKEILPSAGPLRFSDHIEERGQEMFEEITKLRLEGTVAKKADSPYRGGRTSEWLKIRAERTDDFLVVGFTEPKGSRVGFGALHIGQFVDGELLYEGRVGTGFSADELEEIRGELEALRQDQPACAGPIPTGEGHCWVKPELVCEIRFKELTEEGLLRQPVFVRFRDDKRAEECVRQGTAQLIEEPVRVTDTSSEERKVPFTNLDKVFWPEEGYTKGDLIEYYRCVSKWLLPYLRDRPLVMTRFPDGIEGKSFFQKDAPGFAPEWIRTERLWSEGSEREIGYFIGEDEESLLYVANLASIPLHIWSSRVKTLELPDWCIIDLDPTEAPFKHVVTVARAIRSVCEDVELPSFVKTSGSKGLHILVPLGRQCTYEQSRSLGQLLAHIIELEMPDIATTARSLTKREGKVYLDYVQNGHGRLLVAPFSVRPLPGAPVSTPLKWSEVTARLDIQRYTIRTVPKRFQKMKEDPLAQVIELKPDLGRALELLLGRFQ